MAGEAFFRRLAPGEVQSAAASPLGLAGLFRRVCDECGNHDLWWGTASDLLQLRLRQIGSDLDHEAAAELNALREGASFFGQHTQAWQCLRCRHWGLFGSPANEGGWPA